MVKHAFKVLAPLLVALLLASCGGTSYVSRNQNITQVSLERDNFKVIGSVEGKSHATYVLGIIGGVSRRAIKENAVADMYRNAMLTGSQAVANITETAKVRSYILWTRVEYIATGTIVEFTE